MRSLSSCYFTGFVFFLAARWGYRLSSEGQAQLSTMFAAKQAAKDTTFVDIAENPRLMAINAQLDKINGNIDQQATAQSAAYSIKWKKRVTENGQKLADQAGNNLGTLNNTQNFLLAENSTYYSKMERSLCTMWVS